MVGPEGRVYSFVPAEIAHVTKDSVGRMRTLAKEPGISVAEVADGVGFTTPAHFVATFRRTMGVTLGALEAALLR